jgi:MYXO-CTERM domain-containing protein
VALAPKCLVCVAAYAGLGAALGVGGREICGAPTNDPGAWVSWLPLLGVVLAGLGRLASRRSRVG